MIYISPLPGMAGDIYIYIYIYIYHLPGIVGDIYISSAWNGW